MFLAGKCKRDIKKTINNSINNVEIPSLMNFFIVDYFGKTRK